MVIFPKGRASIIGAMRSNAGRLWDLYCRVVDHHGDAGVCWRLAADLAARGERVRLVIDDAAPLAFMAPSGAPGVQVWAWPGPHASTDGGPPGDVVIEAFGCALPEVCVTAMLQRCPPPVWLNLEYLSAEAYVERSHGLPSPQANGLDKWFYYPGFTPRTGGLLREPSIVAARSAFDRDAWLATRLGLRRLPGERVLSLYCYDNPSIPALMRSLAGAPTRALARSTRPEPTLLLLTQGAAQRQVLQAPQGIRLHPLPWLSQADFDNLLWSCDINFVRGEDSAVRALWAGAPFAWQLYPQHDGAHFAKLEALLVQAEASPATAALWRAWNSAPGAPWPDLPPLGAWQQELLAWRGRQLEQGDLTSRLIEFVAGRGGGNGAGR